MIKDLYRIPMIEDTLDSLNGAVWFTALDLKSGCGQVEMVGIYTIDGIHCGLTGILQM